jgi:lysophospholipase L1-like esterase
MGGQAARRPPPAVTEQQAFMKRRYVVLLCGLFLLPACESDSPTEPSPGNRVRYSAIGASDAIGFGGSVVCIPFSECQNGTGYVQVITRRMQSEGRTVTLTNLGIPGAVLSPDTQALSNSYGREVLTNFLQQQLPFVPRESTLVTVFAGANDVNAIGGAVERGLGGSDPTNYIASQTQKFGVDLRALVEGIRDRAPDARIVFLNLPNMAAFPYASGLPLAHKRWLQTLSVGFSAQINALTSSGALVVDLMCNGAFYDANLISSDGFHPNDNGYAFLADVLYPAAVIGTAMPPPSSCAQMTIF